MPPVHANPFPQHSLFTAPPRPLSTIERGQLWQPSKGQCSTKAGWLPRLRHSRRSFGLDANDIIKRAESADNKERRKGR